METRYDDDDDFLIYIHISRPVDGAEKEEIFDVDCFR